MVSVLLSLLLSTQPRRGSFNREIYRQRNLVERAINRIKQFRRIATRYEKLAQNYTAMLTIREASPFRAIALILLWL
ncbi:transposase [Calothrix sp. CCY 0018]|uniref:transposase n=1 Tax=Calothrix sp. CCY 0018 TaxID=3103864 RepID=UPI0039C71BFD